MRNSSAENLESAVVCGSSAVEYCVSYSPADEMASCIYHHNARCQQNLYGSTQSGMERQIQVEILLAVIYLLIPFILASWALLMMLRLNREISQQMNLYLSDPSVEDQQPDRHQPLPIDLSFLKISFFVRVHTTSQPHALFRSDRSARVLDQVTGTFRSQQVSAIMGPSGSGCLPSSNLTVLTLCCVGKTTLLKLIGGRMYSGDFFGIRSINSEVPPAASYDTVTVLIFCPRI